MMFKITNLLDTINDKLDKIKDSRIPGYFGGCIKIIGGDV